MALFDLVRAMSESYGQCQTTQRLRYVDPAWGVPELQPVAPLEAVSELPIKLSPSSRFYVEIWEADEMVIMTTGGPIGCTLSRPDAHTVARWINSAFPELMRRMMGGQGADEKGTHEKP